MKTHEIFELASLDALGLLDEREREAFENAFKNASPSVQAQVRREQARIARDESLLPNVEAPVGLRARVLAAVRRAVATTGAERDTLPFLSPPRGVAPVWRAAAVGCAAAAIVLAFTTLQMKGEYDRLSSAQYTNEVFTQMAAEFGAAFPDTITDHNTRFVQFSPEKDADGAGQPNRGMFHGKAVIVINPDRRSARLFGTNFETGAEYALAVVDQDGSVQRLLRFSPSGASVVEQLDETTLRTLDLDSPSGATFSVTRSDATGDSTVLRGSVTGPVEP